MSTESRLRVIRDELKVSREKLAVLAGGKICTSTIRNVEVGRHRVTHDKAELILQAVNMVLTEMQKPTLDMADLGLKLY